MSKRKNLIVNKSSFNRLVKTSFVLNSIEITSLLLLTYVSSREYHTFHALFFCLFLLTSTLYMLLISLSFFYKQEATQESLSEEALRSKSKNLRIILFTVYLLSLLTSLYFYIRHNKYCEPFMFSYFSLCEYITVVANISFHSLIFIDLDLFKNSFKVTVMSILNEKKFP